MSSGFPTHLKIFHVGQVLSADKTWHIFPWLTNDFCHRTLSSANNIAPLLSVVSLAQDVAQGSATQYRGLLRNTHSNTMYRWQDAAWQQSVHHALSVDAVVVESATLDPVTSSDPWSQAAECPECLESAGQTWHYSVPDTCPTTEQSHQAFRSTVQPAHSDQHLHITWYIWYKVCLFICSLTNMVIWPRFTIHNYFTYGEKWACGTSLEYKLLLHFIVWAENSYYAIQQHITTEKVTATSELRVH